MAKLKVKSWEADWSWKSNRGTVEYKFENGQSGGVSELLADDFHAIIGLLSSGNASYVDQASQTVFASG